MAICQHCSVEFTPGRGSKGIYCSRSCRGKAACGKGEKGLRYKGGKEKKICDGCGDEFEMWPSQLADSGGGQARRFCSRKCADQFLVGERNHMWRGGRFVDSSGYVSVYMPGHPKAINGHVHEHILVAEMKHGGPLPEGTVVHHEDEVKTNNNPENIIIVYGGHSEHMKIHQSRRYPKE